MSRRFSCNAAWLTHKSLGIKKSRLVDLADVYIFVEMLLTEKVPVDVASSSTSAVFVQAILMDTSWSCVSPIKIKSQIKTKFPTH